jgi:hypothetical protein
MQSQSQVMGQSAPHRAPIVRELDELLDLAPRELSELYRQHARVPELADVKGDLRGRMLAIPALTGLAAAIPRALARSNSFPWRGKTFSPRNTEEGEGINRVILDRFHLFRFETFVGPSRAGSFDAVQLDYDLPENPFFIRAIKDEIRELSPGLYLGQAYVMVSGKAHLGLYFGLSK